MSRITFVEAAKRQRLSRQRLMDSEELSRQVRAWRLWACCMELTATWSKSSDKVHVVTLANMADMRADKASALLRQFDEQGIVIWRKDTGKRSKGFLALPSWAEPEAKAAKAAPKRKCWSCGSTNLEVELYMGEPSTLRCRDCHSANALEDPALADTPSSS